MMSPTGAPTKQFTEQDFKIDQLVYIIEGTLEYFQTHLRYIVSMQLGRVKEEDVKAYLAQLFPENTTLPTSSKQLLAELKDTVSDHVARFTRMLQIFETQMTEEKIATLRQNILQNLEQDKVMRKNVATSTSYGIIPDFNLKIMLTALLKQTEEILPPWIKQADRYLKMKLVVMPPKEADKTRITAMYPVFSLNYDLPLLTKDIYESSKKIINDTKKILIPADKLIETRAYIKWYTDKMVELIKKANELNEAPGNNNVVDQKASFNPTYNFINIVVGYLRAIDSFNKFKADADDFQKHLADRKRTLEKYQRERNEASQSIKTLISHWGTMHGRLQETLTPDIMRAEKDMSSSLRVQMDNLKDKINALYEKWPEEIPQDIIKLTDVKEKLDQFKESISELKGELNECNEKLMEIVQRVQDARKEQIDEAARLKEAFIKEQRDKYEAYRKLVQLERDKKEKTKRAPSASPLFAPAPIPTVTYKDASVEELLNNLSDYYLNVLSTIMNLERGCTYSDLFNLVKNHLQGEILEIGNGSSHLRIVLRKFTIDVPVNAEDMEEALKALSSATGGMFRAHHGTHPSREIINFNLRLIKSVFERAGITPQVVADLQRNKADPGLRPPA